MLTKKVNQSYHLGMLRCHGISILDESLELVVLGKGDDLQHCTKFRENLQERHDYKGHNFNTPKINKNCKTALDFSARQ